ncbi:RNA polymerase subunit sigma-24 [Paenibacillus sp. A3]|uniref:RNA polymerase sigma factor n=1 Tax=Paenibacillus sp. A3 TaxID=1337054 RepID=UPI0006D5AE05|nr:RNA polymerase sigma factor [Paenibacillus sp. A3]KPV60432.1 RNA polymerase subunit sigma-24 [Paenibacillus sp. A3]
MDQEKLYMKQCRNGDKEAFFKLIEPLLSRVYSTSAAILRSSHLAEDAVQNALLEAYQAIMNGKNIRNFKSWFNHLTACRALDLARQRSKLASRTGDLEEIEVPDEHASPIDALIRKEAGHELLESVMSLDINHRTVVILYYYQELSLDEIANVLSVKKGTIKSRLHAARLKLNEKMMQPNPKQVMEC